MARAQKPLVRLAVAMHAQLEANRRTVRVAELPAERWRRCESLVGNVRRAELRGWRLAADQLRHDLRCALRSLEMELEGLTDRLDAAPKTAPLSCVGDVYRDLVALQLEFAEVRSDLRARTLSVITESIELENVRLGPFEIRLHAFANASATEVADLLIVFGPGIERFDYFRLLQDVVAGKVNISEVLASQERFDNWFSDSAAWSAHQAAVKQQRA